LSFMFHWLGNWRVLNYVKSRHVQNVSLSSSQWHDVFFVLFSYVTPNNLCLFDLE
jgi:hypothetical protein